MTIRNYIAKIYKSLTNLKGTNKNAETRVKRAQRTVFKFF